MSGYSEDSLIEQPTIAVFAAIGWETLNGFNEAFGPTGTLGRESSHEVVLITRLRCALERLNPTLPAEAIAQAIEELSRDRSSLSLTHANLEIATLLKQGIPVTIRGERGDQVVESVVVIDWNEPDNNDFLLASQLWVTGDVYSRRADLVGFVNGLPLVLLELKATHKRLELAYRRNLRDYKTTVPTSSGTTPSSSSLTAARAASEASPPIGSTSTTGSGSMTRASRASSRSTPSYVGRATSAVSSTSSRTSPSSARSPAG